jgi:hypothetical protein
MKKIIILLGLLSMLVVGCGDVEVAANFCEDRGHILLFTGYDNSLQRVHVCMDVYDPSPHLYVDVIDDPIEYCAEHGGVFAFEGYAIDGQDVLVCLSNNNNRVYEYLVS